VPEASPGQPMTDRERRERMRAIAETHTWVGACEIPLPVHLARTGNLRAALTLRAETRVRVVDVYCAGCKATWEAVIGVPCAARDPRTSEHLRGGTPGERKKRGRQPRVQRQEAS